MLSIFALRSCKGPFTIGFLGFLGHAMFDVGWVRGPGYVAAIVMGVAFAEAAKRVSNVLGRQGATIL